MNGNLSDGSGPSNYADFANCEWIIAPPGSLEITLRFTEFSTQPVSDFVTVFQCTDVHCGQQQQLAELSGTLSSVQTMTSTTGFLRVVFTSDGSSSSSGFTALWSSVCAFFPGFIVPTENGNVMLS